MTKAGQEILQGVQDALAYMQGDLTRGQAHYVTKLDIDMKNLHDAGSGATAKKGHKHKATTLKTRKKA